MAVLAIKKGIMKGALIKKANLVAKAEKKILQSFNSIESIFEKAGKLKQLKNGVEQGFIKGNPQDIFKGLSQQYQAAIQINFEKRCPFFAFEDIIVHLTSSKQGIPMLRINKAGKIYKIRIV